MYCKKCVEKAHLLQFTRRVVLYDSTISLHQASRVRTATASLSAYHIWSTYLHLFQRHWKVIHL